MPSQPLQPPRHVKRILLKISGESLGDEGGGVAPTVVATVAAQIARVHRLGVEVAVVCGGGNLLRGAEFAKLGTNRATADHMGMLATAINALALHCSRTKATSLRTLRGFSGTTIRPQRHAASATIPNSAQLPVSITTRCPVLSPADFNRRATAADF